MIRRLHPLVQLTALASLIFLYLPMLAIAFLSVNAARYGWVWRGLTLDWYRRLFGNETIIEATRNTILLAVISTIISTILGSLLAIGLWRFPWSRRSRQALELTVYFPLVTPDMIFAASIVIIFGLFRYYAARMGALAPNSWLSPGLVMMIVAHVTFQIAFVALVVRSRLATIGPELEEAARDLYADSRGVMLRVILPLLAPGIVAGALLAFTLSLDDFIISFFTAGPDSMTLPIFIYSSTRRGITPQIYALSMLIFFLNVLLVLGLERLTRIRTE